MPDASERPVVIVGAGMGGLTLALALARRGRRVTLIEKRTRLEEAGAGIQLSPNASRVLIDLGLGKALARVAGEPARLVVRRGRSGATLASAPLGPAMRERYGAPYCVVHRADLQMLLLDAVRALPQIRMHFGRTVEAVSEGPDGVTVSVAGASGRETVEGEVLVGADGLWSKIAVLAGDMSEPEFRGHVAWRAMIDASRTPAGIAKDETGLWLGPGAHLVHYPVRGGARINIVAVVANPVAESGWSREGDPDLVRARFEDWAEPVRALLSAVDQWSVWSLFDRPVRRRWTHGRITLLGDAAHPVLPFLAQGGAMAVEDAAVLAAELASGKDVATALKAYEAVRRPRVSRVRNAAVANGRTYHLGFPFDLARDLVIRRTGERLTDRYDWVYGWKPER